MLVVQPSGRRFALVKPVLLGGAPGCQAQHVGAAAKLLWTMRFHASGEPVQLRNDDGIHRAGIHQGQKPRHAGTVQGLRGLARVNDDFRQFRALHHGHSADLLRLRFERNAAVRLFLCAHPDVTDCFHVSTVPNTPSKVTRKSLFFSKTRCKIEAGEERDYRRTFWSSSASKARRVARSVAVRAGRKPPHQCHRRHAPPVRRRLPPPPSQFGGEGRTDVYSARPIRDQWSDRATKLRCRVQTPAEPWGNMKSILSDVGTIEILVYCVGGALWVIGGVNSWFRETRRTLAKALFATGVVLVVCGILLTALKSRSRRDLDKNSSAAPAIPSPAPPAVLPVTAEEMRAIIKEEFDKYERAKQRAHQAIESGNVADIKKAISVLDATLNEIRTTVGTSDTRLGSVQAEVRQLGKDLNDALRQRESHTHAEPIVAPVTTPPSGPPGSDSSPSPTQQSSWPPVTRNPCDLNGDGKVDSADVDIAIKAALGTVPNMQADLNGDGVVNALDVQLLIAVVSGKVKCPNR